MLDTVLRLVGPRGRALAFSAAIAASLAACDTAPPEPSRDPALAGAALNTSAPDPDAPLPEPDAKLLAPEKATEQAPATFKAKFHTTQGDFVLEAHREWSPLGVDRLYNLVKIGFFSDVAFFRAVEGFVAQFGIHGHPKVSAVWQKANIQDEPVKEGNKRGRLVFAKAGPNTRSTQFFLNLNDNKSLDAMGFAALAEVVEGMSVVDSLYKGYGEAPSRHQGTIGKQGNSFLRKEFPKLDYITSAEIVP